jgi:hypothetical protein
MIEIQTNCLYSRAELLELLGKAALFAAKEHGLFAVGDRYLGQRVLDTLLAAHKDVASQRVATGTTKGERKNEATNVATDKPRRKTPGLSGEGGTHDLLSKVGEVERRLR